MARILYIIFHSVVSGFIYVRLRKYGVLSVAASILYFIFTPYDIMALSYNTMGLDFITVTGVLLGTADYSKKSHLIISGVAFACAVLCCPYLAAVYIIFGICVLVHIAAKKKFSAKNIFATELFSGRTFLWFTVGIAVPAVIVIAFILSRASIGDIITNLPYLLTDPEHPQLSFGTKLSSYFNSIWDCHEFFKYSVISYAIMLAAMILDKKRKSHRSVYLIISSLIAVFTLIIFIPNLTSLYYNALMFPMIFVGITSYILCNNKPKTILAGLFILGILYSFAISYSSNQYFYVISMALSASSIASFVFLSILIKEMHESGDEIQYSSVIKRTSFVMIALTIILQGIFQITVKATHCFWESGDTSTLTSKITSGPAKGIYTNQANWRTYQQIYSDLQTYDDCEPDNILILSSKTWCYLAVDDYPYGTFSAWMSGENEASIERLETFYSLNPDKIPEYIYIPKDSSWNFENLYTEAAQKGYSVEENDVSYKLSKN